MTARKAVGAALVTGASSGIGLELAKLLAADGYDLVLVARSEERLRTLGDELSARHGVRALVVPADLTEREARREVAARVTAEVMQIDILINNAGYGLFGEFAETDLTAELRMIDLNVVALTHLSKLFLPAMIGRRRGRIMNVASTAAFQAGPLMAVYYATKAYVLSFSEALAEELRRTGVTVTAFCPGPTDTNFQGTAKLLGRSALFRRATVMAAEPVARAGYDGMMRGRRIVIPGVRNKLLIQSERIAPRWVVAKIVKRLQRATD